MVFAALKLRLVDEVFKYAEDKIIRLILLHGDVPYF
jgi:hypothetical protein